MAPSTATPVVQSSCDGRNVSWSRITECKTSMGLASQVRLLFSNHVDFHAEHTLQFLGFYYVCVDFNSHPHAATAPRSKSSVREENTAPGGDVHPASPSKSDQPRRTSLGDRSMHPDSPSLRSPSAGPAKSGPNAATMSGFYFHQNSEPCVQINLLSVAGAMLMMVDHRYQQLSLQHVSESVNTCYELR